MRISPENDIFNLNERKHTDFEWIKDWFSFCVAIEPRQLDNQAFQQKKAEGSLIEEVDGTVICRCPQNMDDQQSLYSTITALHNQMQNQSHTQQINNKLRSQILLAQKVKYFLDDIGAQQLSETQQKIYSSLYQAIADTASLIPDQITSLSPTDEKEVLTHLLGNETFYDIATERVENTDDGHLTPGYKLRKIKQVLNIMSRVHASSRDITRSATEHIYDLFVEGSHLLDMTDRSLSDSIFRVGEDKLFDEATLHDGTKVQDLIQGYAQRRPSATAPEKEGMMRDFMKKINQSYSLAYTNGSPRQTLEKREVQCVAKAHLGEMLCQIEGVEYNVISMDEHVASLVQYDQKWYYMDIGFKIFYQLSDAECADISHHTLPRGVIETYKNRTKNNALYETLIQYPTCNIVDGSLGSVYFNIGNNYFNKQEYNKAIQAYQKAIETGQKQAYFNMGNAYLNKQEYNKAIQTYQKAIEVGDFKAYPNMGNVYDEKKEYNKAIQAYQKAIEAGYLKTYLNMGSAYFKNQEHNKAIQAYQKFIDFHKDKEQLKEHVTYAQYAINMIHSMIRRGFSIRNTT